LITAILLFSLVSVVRENSNRWIIK
jgi:hypothetical protein